MYSFPLIIISEIKVFKVAYRCTDGSKFDTTGNGDGDTVQLETSCQWRKSWEPWGDPARVASAESSILPPCIITHCIRWANRKIQQLDAVSL